MKLITDQEGQPVIVELDPMGPGLELNWNILSPSIA